MTIYIYLKDSDRNWMISEIKIENGNVEGTENILDKYEIFDYFELICTLNNFSFFKKPRYLLYLLQYFKNSN